MSQTNTTSAAKSVRLGPRQTTNQSNVILGKFGVFAAFATLMGVVDKFVRVIVGAGIPAKIRQPVVGAVTVRVTRLLAIPGRAYKCSEHKPMNIKVLMRRILSQVGLLVSVREPCGAKDAAFERDGMSVLLGKCPWLAAYTTKIAYGIQAFIPNDGKPAFYTRVSHETSDTGKWSGADANDQLALAPSF